MSQSFASKIVAANAALLADGNLAAVGEFFTTDYVVHITEGDLGKGHGVIKKSLSLYHRAFSNIQVEVEVLVKSKDRVAWQRTVRATHSGPFQGFPATGRAIVWRDMVTSRFEKGLIAEEWLVTDLAERLLRARKR